MNHSLKAQLYQDLESGKSTRPLARHFAWLMCVLIILNVIAVAAETVEPLSQRYGVYFTAFEIFSVAVFTIEYAIRLWVCTESPLWQQLSPLKARLRYARTSFAIIDLLAIVPFYLAFVVPADLRFLRIFRLIRLLKLARYSPALTTIARVLRAERRAIFAALIVMMGLLLLAASLAYLAERHAQPEHFGNIPQAIWWAVATLTTVGYGDVVPVTTLGRIFGSVFMIFGLGLFALPIGIIATGFAQEIHRRDFVVTWEMVSKVPLFAELSPADLINIARLLHSRTVEAGTVIARRGEIGECMYFIVSGEVVVQFSNHSQPVRLTDGDFFGEIALLHHNPRRATITAATKCHLMILEATDFNHLVDMNPEIGQRIKETAKSRLADVQKEDPTLQELHQS